MKRTWSIASNLSLIILLMVVAAFGWMWFSKKLDGEKIKSIRDVILNQSSDDIQQQELDVLDVVPGPGGSSTRRLDARGAMDRSLATSREGLQQEAVIRQRQIEQALEQLAQVRENLALERAAFKTAQDMASTEIEGRDPEIQFRRSVQLMESAQPGQAKVWLLAMVESDRFQDAVATLDAMRERSASRILREFQSAGELELAGQLLEALGRYGTVPVEDLPKEVSQRVSYGSNKPDQP